MFERSLAPRVVADIMGLGPSLCVGHFAFLIARTLGSTTSQGSFSNIKHRRPKYIPVQSIVDLCILNTSVDFDIVSSTWF